VTSGASSDFQAATDLATAMVREWGMSDVVGNRVIEAPGPYSSKTVSEKMQQAIDEEIDLLLQSQYAYAVNMLKKHETQLHQLGMSE
jgi:ATP-dependent metalloprotease